MEYAPAKQFVSYKMFKIIGPNEIEVADAPIAADGTLAISDLASGYYKIYATDTNNADDVAYVDVWSSVEGHQFNVVDESTLDYVHAYKIYSWGDKDYGVIDDVSISENGKFFVVDFPSRGNSSDNTIKVYPIHSLGYYEQFKGLGGLITFDYYVISDCVTTSYRLMGNSDRPNIDSGVQNTMTFSLELDRLLENWSVYNSNKTDDAYTFLIKELGWVWMDKSTDAIQMAVGNFKFSYTEVAKVEDAKVNLVDVKGLETLDLATYITDEGKAVIQDGYSYVLSCKSYDVKLGSSSIVDVTKAENQRLFDLKVYDESGFLVYKGKVDLYDSSVAPVWNSIDADCFQLYSGANAPIYVGLTTAKVQKDGSEVDAIKIEKSQLQSSTFYVMNPVHSKEYYELMSAQGYTLTFSVFFDAPSGTAPLNQFLGKGGQIGVESQLTVDSGWWNINYDLTELVAKWSNYVEVKGENGTIAWGDRSKNGLFYTYNPKAAVTIYVTGFQLTKNA